LPALGPTCLQLSTKSKDYVEGVINAITSGEPPYIQAACAGKMEGYQVSGFERPLPS